MDDASFAERLHGEAERWVAAGLVSADQAAALRERYPLDRTERRSRAVAALASIGGIAVGVGVIGFFAANWDAIPHGLRLALLTAVTAGAYGAAYHLRDRTRQLPRVGEALYVVGVLLFGASLFLVGQMYHVEAHDPLALLLWAAGATATALVVRARSLDWLAVVLFTVWIGYEFGVALDDAGGDAIVALPVVAVFWGGALYGLGTAGQERLRGMLAGSAFPSAARRLGLPVLAAGVFVFTFSGAAEELGGAGDALDGLLLAGFLLLAALALAAAGVLALTRRRSAVLEGAALAVVVATTVVAVLAGGDGDFWAIVFNVLFAAGALGLVYAGYLSGERWLVNLGVVLVAIDLIARYFDFFWSALPRSLGMIGAGLLILGIAYVLERQRRRVLTRMAR